MDKYVIDLDSILDKLEENDDDTDRGHPPSLVKIANCDTFSYNNSFPSIDWYRRRPQQSTDQSSNQPIACSTSSMSTNPYKRHLFSYTDQSNEKLDSSEAEFGISIKPIETENNRNKDLINSGKTTYGLNESIEKNRLIASLLEKAKWKTEDINDTNDCHEYDIETTSSDEDISDEVLYVAIDQKSDTNKGSDDCQQFTNDSQEIEIKILPSIATLMVINDNAIESLPNEPQNNVLDLKDCVSNNGFTSDAIEKNVSENRDLNESQNLDQINEEICDEIIAQIECQSLPKTETNTTEENVINEDKIESNWETDSIKNNFDNTSNVVKFSEIEVNINEFTEQEINAYLSEFDGNQCEDNQSIDPNIKPNVNIENIAEISCDSTNDELLTTNSDKDVISMSLSTSSVSIEDNDKISDISDSEVCHQSNTSTHSDANENNCNDIESESIDTTEDTVNRTTRPNTLPIPSNTIDGNSVETNEEIIENNMNDSNDENNNDSNNNETDNNVPNDEQLEPIVDFSEEDMTLGLSESEQMLGKVRPFWIPDNESQMCMHCDIKFNLLKRRHHCRACGKVLCAQCCNSRAKLVYLDGEVARVCQICYSTLARIAAIERTVNDRNDSNHSSPSTLRPDELYSDSASGPSTASGIRSPDPNNPSEYCSTIPPLEQELLNRPPPTVMVPVGVLKRGDRPKGEPKQVVFSDGIRPGGDLTETSQSSSNMSFLRRTGRAQHKLKSPPVENIQTALNISKSKASRIVITDSNGALPPIRNYYDLNSNKSVKTKPSVINLIEFLRNKDLCPVVFALTKNLHIFAKLVFKDCCVHSECWTFATKGMATIGQDEILVTLERLPEEDSFPRDIFRLFTFIYDSASKGTAFNDLSHVFFPDGLFGNKDNSGFLFTRPTLQCFNKLVLPAPPFLLAILIHKWEIPWAKVFPLRLLLRLGAEYKYYPSPIVSYRCRKPVYCEIGHTIMNVLADFRNFQYTLPTVAGLTIHLEDKRITVHLPRNRYEKVQKVLTNSNEHVLAFGANFSLKADSHLVCTQNDVDGQYTTQSINIEGAERKTTGACFIVFSGALKSSTGLTAKMSIVEDGLLVQIPPNTMTLMRSALKDMKNYSIDCGKVGSQPEEVIHMFWGEEDTNVNLGVRSPIDATNLEGIQSIRIYNGTDYTNEKLMIRWTEVFFLQINELSRRTESLDPSRLAEMIAQSFCLALTSCLDQLFDNGFSKIGLRINLDSDKVGYEVGSNGSALPSQYTTELDGALIPVIMENISSGVEDQIVMELLFHILVK